MPDQLQPLLHDATVVLRAPTQAWSAHDGSMGSAPIHGIYFSDVRLVSSLRVTVGERAGEHIATLPHSADTVGFVTLQRHLDGRGADPRIRSTHTRSAGIDGVTERVLIESHLPRDIDTTVRVVLRADLSDLDGIKAGGTGASGADGAPAVPAGGSDAPVAAGSASVAAGGSASPAAGSDAPGADPASLMADSPAPVVTVSGESARWSNDAVTVELVAAGASVSLESDGPDADGSIAHGNLVLEWAVTVPSHGSIAVGWTMVASDASAVVRGATGEADWSIPVIAAGDDRIARWVSAALGDLDALRLTTTAQPGLEFLAAGAPWFFTLFGRDSIWAARFMLPLGTGIAGDTLRILASLQGTAEVAQTAEQPGKIMHELRRGTLSIPRENISLPPLYYGTVDATALWVNLLHDAWKWGLPENEVRALLPTMGAALEWMRDYGDADGDGLLEYVDATGRGLANQGWKDSGDSVQWRDGTLATGPIALCEVQAYAYEAATHGADLLDHFGEPGADTWRDWASALRTRFHETFWISDAAGDYPAIALDAQKRPVDTVTSNLGHLLGTGLLDARQAALVARRLVSPELDSGYGLRTMSTDSAGYWPLSYHGGSVWTHDTAIAISGLAREGFTEEAASLTRGLLAAASAFDYRMPELHSGDPADRFPAPVPYPAACRPQAWSAAAAISVLASGLGLEPDAGTGTLSVSPTTLFGALRVSGLRLGGADVSLTLNTDGEVTAGSGAHIEVR
jgi:glycogen debranching enzyme